MTKHDTEQMLRWLEGAMTPDERADWERRLAASPALRQDCERLRALRDTLRATVREDAREALRPFFTDRLMKRLQPPAPPRRDDIFAEALAALFRPVLVASMALILLLAAYNVTHGVEDAERSPAEAVLGLPPVTLTSAYELELSSAEINP
ncbi:MAG: hypothetical protein KatS3mg044_0832 [Rhodothermaceae bacterium]|nr:MAG: hypothetical protein KatS3mg044_0832 [Rhodothermaceae bacterium]